MDSSEMLCLPVESFSQHTDVKVSVLPDLDALYTHIARQMADTIINNNKQDKPTSFILPVGPTGQYPIFADIVNCEGIDCSRVTTFNMDEYLDWQGKTIGETHPLSFKRTMQDILFSRIDDKLNIPSQQRFFPDISRIEEMDEALDKYGPVDICYAGVGFHGHVAFNEGIVSRWHKVSRKEFLGARTHLVALADDTFVINSVREAGGNYEIIPPFAVTVGMKDIMASRHIEVLFYCCHWQRTVLRRTLFQKPGVEFPGTFLQNHPSFSISIDAFTAAPPQIKPV